MIMKTVRFIAIYVILSLTALPAWSQGSGLSATKLQYENFPLIEKQRGFPMRGTLQSRVQGKYGEPDRMTSAVGMPPISQWIYPEFSVYFENNYVITTVANQDRLPEKLKLIQ